MLNSRLFSHLSSHLQIFQVPPTRDQSEGWPSHYRWSHESQFQCSTFSSRLSQILHSRHQDHWGKYLRFHRSSLDHTVHKSDDVLFPPVSHKTPPQLLTGRWREGERIFGDLLLGVAHQHHRNTLHGYQWCSYQVSSHTVSFKMTCFLIESSPRQNGSRNSLFLLVWLFKQWYI